MKSDYLTGLECDILPLSIRVMFEKPQAKSYLETWHPRDPAPKSRHLIGVITSRSREGAALHFMSLRLSQTA